MTNNSSNVEIRTVATPADLRLFVDIPWRLYNAKDHPNWVPPLRESVYDALDNKKNPFYHEAARELFIAFRNGVPVGRIAAIENRAHNRFNEDKAGFWGFFESVNDQAVASALFDAAERWLAPRGLETMRGPFNPSTNYECGLLVDGFQHRPTFMTAWNPPWYDALCAGAGMGKAKDLLGLWFGNHADFAPPELLVRHAERAVAKGHITFRTIEPAKFAREVAICWDIYNNAWEKNWGFVPMGQAEFNHMAKDMKHLAWQDLSFIAYVDGEPAGFMFVVPDYNEALIKNRSGRLFPLGLARMLWYKSHATAARVMALGVKDKFRSRTILALFSHEIMRRGAAVKGATGAEASWLLEDNHLIVKPMRALGATDRMRWRLYERGVRVRG